MKRSFWFVRQLKYSFLDGTSYNDLENLKEALVTKRPERDIGDSLHTNGKDIGIQSHLRPSFCRQVAVV